MRPAGFPEDLGAAGGRASREGEQGAQGDERLRHAKWPSCVAEPAARHPCSPGRATKPSEPSTSSTPSTMPATPKVTWSDGDTDG